MGKRTDRLIGDLNPNGFKDGDVVNARMMFAHILPEEREDIIGNSIAILTDEEGYPVVRITGNLTIVDCNLNYDMATYRIERY